MVTQTKRNFISKYILVILVVLFFFTVKANDCLGLRVEYDHEQTNNVKVVVKGNWVLTYRWVRLGTWRWVLESVELR